jgi:hypothetical protein
MWSGVRIEQWTCGDGIFLMEGIWVTVEVFK